MTGTYCQQISTWFQQILLILVNQNTELSKPVTRRETSKPIAFSGRAHEVQIFSQHTDNVLSSSSTVKYTPLNSPYPNRYGFFKLMKVFGQTGKIYIAVSSTTVCSPTPRQKLDQSLCWVFYSFDVLEQCNQQTCVVCTFSHVERIAIGGHQYPPSIRRVVRMVLGLLVLVFNQVSRVDTGAMPAPQLTAVHLCSQPGSW